MQQQIPELGDQVPKRGNRLTKFIARTLFRVLGWQIHGEIPNTPKLVVAIAPHTTLRDWSIGVLVLYSLGIRSSWLAKQELFWWPQRVLLNWLDAVPVDRSSHHGLVDQVVDYMNRRQRMVLTIAPEGTRKKPVRWKTGFFYIARGTGAPLLLMAMDHKRKCIRFGPVYAATGEADQLIETMQAELRQTVQDYDDLVR